MLSVRRSSLAIISLLTAFSLRAQVTAPAVTQPVPAQALVTGAAATVIDLKNYFGVPSYNSQIAQFDTTQGKFNAVLLASDAPKSVINFLNYVNRGAYTNSLIHRSVPGFVIQGGGFTLAANSLPSIPTDAPVQNEYKLSNVRGTLAMAKTGAGPDTATSQWFVNLGDNSANLNNQNGGFTVFARVLGTGMTVVDAIAAVPNYDASSLRGDFSALPLTSPSLQPENLVLIRSITALTLYPTAAAPGVLVFSSTVSSSNAVVLTASITGSTLTLSPQNPGTATITVRATDIGGDTVSSTFTVTVTGGVVAPTFTSDPASQTVTTGSTVVFTAAVSGSPAPGYQWLRNGTALAGATSATLVLTGANAIAGDYAVVATNSSNSVTSKAATLAVSNTTDAGRLTNLSVLTTLASRSENFSLGYVVSGASATNLKPLVIRAAGPSLGALGFPGTLDDPKLELFAGPTKTGENEDWGGSATTATAMAAVGGFAYVGPTSRDAAVAANITSRDNSVKITIGANSVTGAGAVIAEVYDATPTNAITASTPRLINFSVIKPIASGDSLTLGFTIGGSTAKTVLIRAVGPGLAAVGVASGTLGDPQLTLFNGASVAIATNDDWGADQQLTNAGSRVGAFNIGNAPSKDAMLMITLPAGGYTARVNGGGNSSGLAIVEVYEVP